VVLAIGHTLRAQEALGCPDALACFLEVVHRLFEDGVFVGHDYSMRSGIIRSPYCLAFSCERAEYEREKKEKRAELLRLSPALGGDRIPAF
jgi:hypothetical protein